MTQLSAKMDTLNSKLGSVHNTGALLRVDIGCIKQDLSILNSITNRISNNVEEHEDHMTTELMMLSQCLNCTNTASPTTSPPMVTCGGTGGC